jgi:isoleucyl-tRNA synthetase
MIAPIIPFTAEEIWSFLPKAPGDLPGSVVLNDMSDTPEDAIDAALLAKWARIHEIRDNVNRVLEVARAQKKIGKSLEAKVVLYAQGELYDFIRSADDILPAVLIVSQLIVENGAGGSETELSGLGVDVLTAEGDKCERCWTFSKTVGDSAEHPTLCAHCMQVLGYGQ